MAIVSSKKIKFGLLGALALIIVITTYLVLVPSRAKTPSVNTSEFGVAIGGYDPVAYFTESRAVRGQEQHVFSWRGAHWYFTTAEHRDRFAAQPERYAPQFGGF